MEVIELMDFDMLDDINKGPIDATHQSSNRGAYGNDEDKYLMAQIIESHADTSHNSVRILNVDCPYTAKDFRSEWDDMSAYQVKNSC
ncbi:unnamed protein product [Lactuca saligna]|uniref:Uncharacterized protein n=1 Tax=Lactuca saligna TaxID=75948 RepID=A0AA35YN30_LACSI|nr:unnamed protein product [Lactuca saligna]